MTIGIPEGDYALQDAAGAVVISGRGRAWRDVCSGVGVGRVVAVGLDMDEGETHAGAADVKATSIDAGHSIRVYLSQNESNTTFEVHLEITRLNAVI